MFTERPPIETSNPSIWKIIRFFNGCTVIGTAKKRA
jgi:hypothetical protein